MDPMQQAISEAFGASVTEALQPLFQRVDALTQAVVDLRATQNELLTYINQAKAKGGLVGKMLGVG